jgi:phage head maturation protease
MKPRFFNIYIYINDCHVSHLFEPWFSQEVPQRGLFVDGLSREYVTCAADVMAVIRAGAVMDPSWSWGWSMVDTEEKSDDNGNSRSCQ